jgi:O-antigen/teichoic acid export membrane protein
MDPKLPVAASGKRPPDRPIKTQIARGIAWMAGARVSVQVLGLASTMILARLLTPADFGLIAMAMSVVALLETLSYFGFEMPLIHKQDATRQDFDTAWSLNIILAGVICTVIALVAPYAADFYSEPRIEVILYCVAAGHFFLSFQNIGTVIFRKQLNFKRDFALQVAQKLSMLAVTIPLAFSLRSYWALVAGMVAGNVAAVIVSYLFLPYRPRFCLGSWRELFSFSKWLQINSILQYLRDKGAVLVLGRLLDASAVGVFSLAREIASIPSSTLVAPLNRAAFPGYAQMSHDARQLRDGYKSILGLIALVVVPATVGIAAVAALIVPVALGPKWQAAVPFLALLSLSGASRSLTASTISVHYATGQPSKQTLTTGIQAATLFPAVAVGVVAFGAIGAAWAYFVHSILIFMPVCYWILLRTTPIRFSDVWQPVWRPISAAAIMFAAVKPVADAWAVPGTLEALPRLLAVTSIGVLIYALAIVSLWWVAGRPEGAERALLRRIGPRLRQLTSRG